MTVDNGDQQLDLEEDNLKVTDKAKEENTTEILGVKYFQGQQNYETNWKKNVYSSPLGFQTVKT